MFEQKYLKRNINLFDNQKSNVKRLVHQRKALLSDRVGSGKTLSVLYSFAYLEEMGQLNHLLVLTPLSAYEKQTWKKDLDTFTELSYCSVDELIKEVGTDYFVKLPEALKKYDVIYGKHTQMKTVLPLLKSVLAEPKTLLCLDEIHAMKNPKSELSVRAKQLTQKCQFFWGITGSSISKSAEDLYNIVNLIQPYYLGGFIQFRDYYCNVKEQVTGRRPDGKLNKVKVISGIRDDREEELQKKLEPLLIKGESFFDIHFDYLDYTLSDDESVLYRKLAKGINLRPDASDEDWLATVLGDDTEEQKGTYIRDVEKFSSRFIYLQYAADGVLNRDGTFDNCHSTKIDLCIDTLRQIVSKGQSGIVYFDYYASLDAVKSRLEEENLWCDVLESSGRNVLGPAEVTEERCKNKPVVILGTKASSESVSYYMLNHIVFFDVPTTPSVFVQTVGRITRKNSLYKDDLNVHIFRSENIDLYKLLLMSCRAYQLELVQGKENNIPDDYKCVKDRSVVDEMKRVLLWCGKSRSFKDKTVNSYK